MGVPGLKKQGNQKRHRALVREWCAFQERRRKREAKRSPTSTGNPKEAQITPKGGSRERKGAQRRAKRGPREAQDCPKEPKGTPREVQGAPKGPLWSGS